MSNIFCNLGLNFCVKLTHSHLVVSFNALKKFFCQKLFFELFCFYALLSHCCNLCKVPKESMSSLDQSGWKLSPETFMQAICILCLVFSVHLVSYVSHGQSKTGLIFSRMFHFREYTKVLIFLFVNIISCCYWGFFLVIIEQSFSIIIDCHTYQPRFLIND